MESYPPSDDDGTMNSEVDYRIYWGLRTLPFDNVPDPRFYVPCSQHDAAHRWLSYGIQTGKGMLLLTGDIGCGKTLLSRRLIVGLSPERYDVALVANPALSPSELLDEVLSQFGLGLVQSKAGRLQTLNERLELNAQRGISSVLVVDEAQDVSIAQLRFLAALNRDRGDSLFFAGDLGQRIFQQPFSWKALGVDVRGRSTTLRGLSCMRTPLRQVGSESA